MLARDMIMKEIVRGWSIVLVLVGCTSGAGTAARNDASTSTTPDTGPTVDAPGPSVSDESATDTRPSCDSASPASPAALGALCIPNQEYAPSFAGFLSSEVSLESQDPGCETRLCLVNHFQGRLTCPYGQDSKGVGPAGTPGCLTPGRCVPVRPNDPITAQTVPAQCSDRTAASAVYCSCRCANANGAIDDAGSYCSCPSGMTCTQLVSSIGGGHEPFSGACCINTRTAFSHRQAWS